MPRLVKRTHRSPDRRGGRLGQCIGQLDMALSVTESLAIIGKYYRGMHDVIASIVQYRDANR